MEGGFPSSIKQPSYNKETLAAMQEARDILSGKIQTKSYGSPEDLLKTSIEDSYAITLSS